MPAAAGIGASLDRYRSLLARIDDVARSFGAAGPGGGCGSCRTCCGPLSLLPIEARALLESGRLGGGTPDGPADGSAACPMIDGDDCRLADARPFACRVRALPALHLDAAGDPSPAGCACGTCPSPAGQAPAPVAEWAAHLYRIDRGFRAALGTGARRIALADLARDPARYRALLSADVARVLVSRGVA
jgi:hypothetical protein